MEQRHNKSGLQPTQTHFGSLVNGADRQPDAQELPLRCPWDDWHPITDVVSIIKVHDATHVELSVGNTTAILPKHLLDIYSYSAF